MSQEKDIVVLVADRDMEMVIKNLLEHRQYDLKIRPIHFDTVYASKHDPDCLKNAAEYLRPYLETHSRAIVMFDREGCGAEEKNREDLEKLVRSNIERNGWSGDRIVVLCIDPELEVWIWSDSPHVADCLGWSPSDLDVWLRKNNYKHYGSVKPREPKEAMRKALESKKTRKSSSTFGNIAKKINLDRCEDPAFLKLKKELRNWFPL